MSPSALARFEEKWTSDANGCWMWHAAIDVHGYGRFRLDGGMRLAHRVSFEHWVGPIPKGLDLDHLCRVRSCVNPAHLEPVTRSENLSRSPLMGAAAAALTTCIRGHDLTPSGDVRISHDGSRSCRICERETANERRRAAPSKPCSTCGRLMRPRYLTVHEQRHQEQAA